MLLIAFALVCGGDDFDLLGKRLKTVESDVAMLKAEVAALKASKSRFPSEWENSGSVEVTKAIEVYSPPVKPLKAVAAVATAPVRAVGQVCSGGVCRASAVELHEVQGDAMPSAYQGEACSNGNCYRPMRRGLFGRWR